MNKSISESMCVSVATLCQGLREVIHHNHVVRGDCTDAGTAAELSAAVDRLHELAMGQDPGELEFLPPAILPTVRRLASLIRFEDVIADRLGSPL